MAKRSSGPSPFSPEDEEVAESEEDTMSNASNRPERVYHQDYIARIRYSNALPPPPGRPKLLDIPTDGLARYTSAGFASRMAREQPINIEVDAELGMPIDLVGMPGIFDGDESSIMAPLNPPPVHPRDKALLRPLASLGKPKSVTSGVSFLRRTEYISSEQSRSRFESNTSRNLIKSTGKAKKKKQTDASRNDPVNIMRSVVKGFDIAHPEDAYKGPDSDSNIRGAAPTQAEVAAWNKPKHPSKPGLTVVDSYPVLPHLDAFPDAGGYMVTKFSSNPSQASDAYDKRLDVGLLQPLPLRPEIIAEQEAKRLAHEADPAHHAPAGAPPYDYAYYLPTDEKSVPNIKKKFDINDPQKDDDSLYTSKVKDTQDGCFQYGRVRAYETGTSTTNLDQKYGEIALALHDSEEGAVAKGDRTDESTLEKAAYYYPIISKSQLKPRRPRNIAQPSRTQEEEETEQVDYLDVTVRDADEEESSARATHRAEIDVKLEQLGLTETQ